MLNIRLDHLLVVADMLISGDGRNPLGRLGNGSPINSVSSASVLDWVSRAALSFPDKGERICSEKSVERRR
jgi:hypothetical protein